MASLERKSPLNTGFPTLTHYPVGLILGIDEIPQMERVMEKRGISKEQYVVAPVDVFESEYLKELVAD